MMLLANRRDACLLGLDAGAAGEKQYHFQTCVRPYLVKIIFPMAVNSPAWIVKK